MGSSLVADKRHRAGSFNTAMEIKNRAFSRITTFIGCSTAYRNASKAEREQIKAFVESSNSNPALRPYGIWTLCHITHLDTGRKFLTVSVCGEQTTGADGKIQPGITAEQMMKVVGLEPRKK